MILLIDNYDSFTYNLYQLLCSLDQQVVVKRNDSIQLSDIETMKPKSIIISPGPGTPDKSGICLDVIKTYGGEIPMLGVCLGHQAIGQAFGGKIRKAHLIKHGKESNIIHGNHHLFLGIENKFSAMRYHSLVIHKESLPACFETLAYSEDDGEIMAISHRSFPMYGVQFHPESIGTPAGKTILSNFLKLTVKERKVYA